MGVKLRRVEEHHAAAATGAEGRFVARAGLAQHADAVVAVKAAQAASPLGAVVGRQRSGRPSSGGGRSGLDTLAFPSAGVHSLPMPRKPQNAVQTLIARGDHPVTYGTLFMGACEYGRAAYILAGYQFLPMVPFAHLVCQSIELGLKSYLVFRGVDEQSLRDIGHDLERAWIECCGKGLKVGFPQGWLSSFNAQYSIYRYWRQGLGWSMMGHQKSVVDALHSALTQIGVAIGDNGSQLACMTRTPATPFRAPP